MATYNNLITNEFVKETRTDGAVTSLTIKMVAYDGDNNMTVYTGDGEYLTHNDATWKPKTIVDQAYYDWDNCTALASQTMTYAVPEADQTSLTQSITHPHNNEEMTEYSAKIQEWREAYRVLEEYHNTWAALYSAVEAL